MWWTKWHNSTKASSCYIFLSAERQAEEAWVPSNKSNALGKIGDHWIHKHFHFFRKVINTEKVVMSL
jgi:hypothetical protein